MIRSVFDLQTAACLHLTNLLSPQLDSDAQSVCCATSRIKVTCTACNSAEGSADFRT